MEYDYLDLMEYVMNRGTDVEDRTGVGTRSVFGAQLKHNLTEGFPALTTKKLAWKAVVSELLWFLEGSTDERRLCEILHGTRDPRKTTIWTANADNQGAALGYENNNSVKQLGPVYGHQWRNFNGFDQIQWAINQIKTNPSSRRIIVSAWNPNDIEEMALPPCHVMINFNVQNGVLNCQVYIRSNDLFLGAPFNIASYALLTHMMSKMTNLQPGSLVISIGDAHIYHNHFDAVDTQLNREPLELPYLEMPEFRTLDQLLNTHVNQYILEDYNPYPSIKAPMAV